MEGVGVPGGSNIKGSACNTRDLGSIPGSGKSPGEGNGNPLLYSCLYSCILVSPCIPLVFLYACISCIPVFLPDGLRWPPWGHKESDTTEWLILSLSLGRSRDHFQMSGLSSSICPVSRRRGWHLGSNTSSHPNIREPPWLLESAQAWVYSYLLPWCFVFRVLGLWNRLTGICICRGCAVSDHWTFSEVGQEGSLGWPSVVMNCCLRPGFWVVRESCVCNTGQPLPFLAQMDPWWWLRGAGDGLQLGIWERGLCMTGRRFGR